MGEARVISDTSGNSKLAKGSEGGRRDKAKDDAVAAAMLAIGVGERGRKTAGERVSYAVVG